MASASFSDLPSRPWPYYDQDEIDAVIEVLKSGRPNQWGGSKVKAFEEQFAAFIGCRHAVALANGTVALDACLRALGIGPGDDVVVSPRSFVASASCVGWAGARPVFADIDPDSQNITAATIAKAITPKTKAVIPVHLAGTPCDMDAIMALAQEKGITVIEDCAQAHGAKWKGKAVGAWGHLAAWSFCQDKHLSTGGEGGMVTTNDDTLYEKIWTMKDHGRNRQKVMYKATETGFRWLADSFGSNWRLTEMQAALGITQLSKLPQWLERRRKHGDIFNNAFSDCPLLRLPRLSDFAEPAYYRYVVFIRPEKLASGWTRDRIVSEAEARGLFCQQGACPEIYREKSFVDAFGVNPTLPVAHELGKTSLYFQVHHYLSSGDVSATAKTMREIFARASS